MPNEQLRSVDVFVRIGENDELLLARIRDVSDIPAAVRQLGADLEQLLGPTLLHQRFFPPADVYAEDLGRC